MTCMHRFCNSVLLLITIWIWNLRGDAFVLKSSLSPVSSTASGKSSHFYHSFKSITGRTQFLPSVGKRRIKSVPPRRSMKLSMLRNFDLPEVIVFYGMDTFCAQSDETNCKSELQPGVYRLVKECEETNTCVILLSESRTESQIHDYIQKQEFYDSISSFQIHLRSSLDMKDASKYIGKGLGHAPCPAALLDAISSVEVQPKGFGGSSGFGTKDADPIRSPLPKHAVVFVNGPTSNSRARTSAARLAGMRCIYIEKEGIGSCDADDLADGVVESLGSKDDWEILTLDDISTPGSFWLNPPNPRDDDGNRIDLYTVVAAYLNERTESSNVNINPSDDQMDPTKFDGLDEMEFDSILADLDPL